MSRYNRFGRSLSQLSPQQIHRQPYKVQNCGFIYHSKSLRMKKVRQIKDKFEQRRQRSLINFSQLSKVLQANQKVFRSSLGFHNLQTNIIAKPARQISSILKSHILKKQFTENKNNKKTHCLPHDNKHQQNQLQYLNLRGTSVSNYKWFVFQQPTAKMEHQFKNGQFVGKSGRRSVGGYRGQQLEKSNRIKFVGRKNK